MGAPVLQSLPSPYEEKIWGYLSGYWMEADQWDLSSAAFAESGIDTAGLEGILADFSSYKSFSLKNEMKYYLLHELKEEILSVRNIYVHYREIIQRIGDKQTSVSFDGAECVDLGVTGAEAKRLSGVMQRNVIKFMTDFYDERPETERDKWRALKIPGVKLSAAAKRQKPSVSFGEIPAYYKGSVKRYMKALIYRRSWSFCTEMLVYIRYFYKVFYANGYGDGFQEALCRQDMERYLGWVAEDYRDRNATFRSRAVSFIRNYLDFIQLAEFDAAPEKDMTRLIFEEDIPRRERPEDTLEKIRYIPEPVRNELDAVIDEIEPAEMKPVYILLRETGWRGTDILNLRYDRCLDYVWNGRSEEYVPYLYDEITKTGIPLHKIPIKPEVAEMVGRLIADAKERSTEENNPDKYLFNTYEGKCKGLPYSKPAFASAVQDLINRKKICDSSGELYHFKTHSLRHTRAQEYTEQGMPVGIIQQILGHCSLQMTLHYSKVSEDMLYKKWSETEKLDLFKPDVPPPDPKDQNKEKLHYEFVRKNLDAVKVPFGVCFKPSKIGCKSQMKMCLECGSFCSSKEDLPAYEAEIKRVTELIGISRELGREEWFEKDQKYLETLEAMRDKILQEGLVHKNSRLREDSDGR